MSSVLPEDRPIRSLIPVRMDRMPWARFHWMVIFGLGTAWILDGLEIQLVASAGNAKTLGMSSAQVGLTSTIYLIGQVSGALIFGRLTDKLGRKRLFIITLAIYLIGSRAGRAGPRRLVLVRVQVCRRHGHRRRVLRDQLRDRRADPRQVPRPGRPGDQRHLLGRRDARWPRQLLLPGHR